MKTRGFTVHLHSTSVLILTLYHTPLLSFPTPPAVSLKHQLTCIEAWKAYAPPPLFAGGPDCKKLVAVLKPAPTASGEWITFLLIFTSLNWNARGRYCWKFMVSNVSHFTLQSMAWTNHKFPSEASTPLAMYSTNITMCVSLRFFLLIINLSVNWLNLLTTV